MKQSLQEKNWELLYEAAHKIIPSFSIMGIGKKFEDMAKELKEAARAKKAVNRISELIDEIEKICAQVCIELQQELIILKNKIT